jgi:hypothetical protein
MTTRYDKSTIAAAVLALTTAVLALAAPAFTDVATSLDQANVIHIKGRQYFPGKSQENGQPVPPVEIDTWIDKQTGRTRQTQIGTSQRSQMNSQTGSTTTTTVTLTETICDGQYTMSLNHTAKTATFSRVSEYYRDRAAERLAQRLWSQLCGQATPLESFTRAGQETINGTPCDIWQVEAAHTLGDGSGGLTSGGGMMRGAGMVRGGGRGPRGAFPGLPGYSTRSKLWLAADSGRLVRAQASSRTQGGPWELQSDYQTIECNGPIPAGIFATEPPAGYTAKNAKATAPPMELRRGLTTFGANGRSVEFGILVAFTLNDGSVIAGWQSRDRQTEGSQEPLFTNLTFGGPLPKLPVEIYALRPVGRAGPLTYTGHHLGYTRKADRFTEWSLYVPAGTPPASVKQAGYDAVYRFNPSFQFNGQFGLSAVYGSVIKTTEDFDKWIGGAMVELSDNGKAPESLTYQKVTELAQRLRTPAKP